MLEASKILESTIHKAYQEALAKESKTGSLKDILQTHQLDPATGTSSGNEADLESDAKEKETRGGTTNAKGNDRTSFRMKLKYFKDPSECAPGLSPGLLNFSPAWHAQGHEQSVSALYFLLI